MRFSLCICLVLLGLPSVAAADRRCAGIDLTVVSEADTDTEADTDALVARTCATARAAAQRLKSCGLPPLPPLTLTIVPRMAEGHAACLGVTDCHAGKITLLHPDALRPDDDLSPIYGPVPAAAIFDSLIVHELAHAAAYAAGGDRAISLAGQEYIAYALQFDWLAPADRDAVLAHNGTAFYESTDEFNELVLGMAPGVFAAKAWIHFSEPQNGCAFVRKLTSHQMFLGLFIP